jgi:hypothetical protein
MPHVIRRHTRRSLAMALGVAALLLPAELAAAKAKYTPLETTIQTTDDSSSTCDAPAWAWPYQALADARTYVLAPGGSFTGGVAPGWQLGGGARYATDAARGGGLGLPLGASAVSPAVCVDLNYPHMRFAHKVVGSKPKGVEIMVEVKYPDSVNPVWTEVKRFADTDGVAAGDGWRISPDVEIRPELGGQTAGTRYAAFRFSAVKKSTTSAEFRIDDVYVDPWMRR